MPAAIVVSEQDRFPGITQDPSTSKWWMLEQLTTRWMTAQELDEEWAAITHQPPSRGRTSGQLNAFTDIGYGVEKRKRDGDGAIEYHVSSIPSADVAREKLEARRARELGLYHQRRQARKKVKDEAKVPAKSRSKNDHPEPVASSFGSFIPDLAVDAPVFGSQVQVGLLQLTDDDGLRVGIRDGAGVWWVCRVEGRMANVDGAGGGGG